MAESGDGDADFQTRVLADLAACGIAAETVTISWEDYLQDYDIVIRGPGPSLDDAQWTCVGRLTLKGYIISFADKPAMDRFWKASMVEAEAYHRSIRPMLQALARARLAARGSLEGLPSYDAENGDLASFAQSLERYAGLQPGSVLRVMGPNSLSVGGGLGEPRQPWDAISLLFLAFEATDAPDHGVRIAVIAQEIE